MFVLSIGSVSVSAYGTHVLYGIGSVNLIKYWSYLDQTKVHRLERFHRTSRKNEVLSLAGWAFLGGPHQRLQGFNIPLLRLGVELFQHVHF